MTNRILLRCFKNRSAIPRDREERLDAQSLYDREFVDKNNRPDLEVSVYDIEPDEWPRVFLERTAAAQSDPPRCAGGADVRPIRDDAEEAPEELCFQILCERHRVVRFVDAAHLRTFVGALHEGMGSGACAVFRHTKDELRSWLFANQDNPEWSAFLSSAEADWKKYPKAPTG